jgi:HlyD family secretion protein
MEVNMRQLEINTTRKKLVGRAGLVLIIALILLTFLSKTINNLLMPDVTTIRPVKGSLQERFETDGVIEYLEKHRIYSGGSWKVTEVKVMQHQRVRKGDLLAVVDMHDMLVDKKAKEYELMKLENELQRYKDSFKPIRLSDYERELQLAREEMEGAERELGMVKELYEAGAETKKNVEAAENTYKNKLYLYQSKKDALEEKRKESAAQTDEYDRMLKEKTAELELKKMELDRETGNLSENGGILSDMDGMIASVAIGPGMSALPEQVLFEIVKVPCPYRVVWYLDAEGYSQFSVNNGVTIEAVGEVAENDEKKIKTVSLTGVISGKEYQAETGRYKFWADIFNKEAAANVIFSEGQAAKVRSVIDSPQYNYLLPKSSITQVQGRDCVFVAKKRQGALGEENYVELREVKILGMDDFNVAVDTDFKKDEMVVSDTSKPLSDMVQVQVRNATQIDAGVIL